ncbi:MAG: hypothetical protein DSO07_12820 [Thermoproteota archaeon]|nr:MAG: hypothetical protein DSO07_12820 [Candidatus Korarchaeota archaeon]
MTLNEDLIEAARWGDLEKVKKLLDRGADVNARDKDGWTPLHWASVHGHLDVIKLLVERGADVNASNHGWTPLHEAASRGHLNVVKFLVERGADVNARDREGRTPLDLARREMYWNVADFLEKAAKDKSEASKISVTPVVKSEEPEKSSPILDLSKYLKNPQKTDQYLNELYRAMLIVKRRGTVVIEENEISSLINSIKAALDKIGYSVHISKDNSDMGSIELSEELMSVLGIRDGDIVVVNSILRLVAKKGNLEYNSVRMHEEDAEVVIGPMIVRGKDRLEGVVLNLSIESEKEENRWIDEETRKVRSFLKELEEENQS